MLSHAIFLEVNRRRSSHEEGDDSPKQSATEHSEAVGMLLHALHSAAAELGWLVRAGGGGQAPVVQNRFAVAFPEHQPRGSSAVPGLGNVLQVMGTEADLAALVANRHVRTLFGPGRLFRTHGVLAVEGFAPTGYARFYRVQPVTPSKDKKREAWRTARGLEYSDKAGAPCELPYCWMRSRTNGERMTVFVGKDAATAPGAEGWANSYGLAIGGRSGALTVEGKTYPGLVVPLFQQ